jgi:hypothetical protein
MCHDHLQEWAALSSRRALPPFAGLARLEVFHYSQGGGALPQPRETLMIAPERFREVADRVGPPRAHSPAAAAARQQVCELLLHQLLARAGAAVAGRAVAVREDANETGPGEEAGKTGEAGKEEGAGEDGAVSDPGEAGLDGSAKADKPSLAVTARDLEEAAAAEGAETSLLLALLEH